MSTTIGEVNINLRMSLAQFKQDVQSGSDAAKTGSRAIADATGASSREATASLALIGEEIGVTIPRHIRTFITDIPGVGAALSSAFSGVAVLAIIEVIVKVIEKVQEYRAKLQENAEAWSAVDDESQNALHHVDEELLQLTAHLDELRGDHLGALQAQLQLINAQTLDAIGAEFDKIGKKADDAFVKMKVGWFESLLNIGNDKGVQNVKEQFDIVIASVKALQEAGKDADIGSVVQAQMDKVKASLETFQKWGTGSEEIKTALENELSTLNSLQTVWTNLNDAGSKKTTIATLQDTARAASEATAETKKLAAELAEAMKFLEANNGPGRTLSKGGTNPFGLPDPNVDPTGLLGFNTPGQNTAQMPLYGGTKEAKDQLDLLTNQNTQLQMASELYDSTRNNSEKYTNEVQALNTLLASGAIDQDTYNRAMTEAKNKYDDVTKGLQEIGDKMGQDIAQAALFGGSWISALKDIAEEIVKVIFQMTILKSLQTASAAAGGGGPLGFFTSLLGGLTHHATGGTVVAGQGYMTGENGPEPFFPSTAGTIIPNEAMRGSRGGDTHVSHNEFHFHGVQDADSFRKSQSQIAADMAAAIGRHAKRNG